MINHVPFLRMDGINQGLLKILFQLYMCTYCILDICFMVEFLKSVYKKEGLYEGVDFTNNVPVRYFQGLC